MPSALETLVKILKLEQETGYKNTAVIGGLHSFASHWGPEAHQQAKRAEHHQLVEELVYYLNQYQTLEENEPRHDAIKFMLGRIMGRVPANPNVVLPAYAPPAEPVPIIQAPTAPAPVQAAVSSPPPPPSPQMPKKQAQKPAKKRAVIEDSDDDEADLEEETGYSEPTETDRDDSRGAKITLPVVAVVRPSALPPRRPRRGILSSGEITKRLAELHSSVETLHKVGPKIAEKLNKLGCGTIEDMLYTFPRRYDDYTQFKPLNRLQPGEIVTVAAEVRSITRKVGSGKRPFLLLILDDGTGLLQVIFFGQPWLLRQFKSGSQVVLSGEVELFRGQLVMTNPEWELLERDNLHTNRIVPVYPLTKGLSARTMRRLMHQLIEQWRDRIPDYLPESVLERIELPDLNWAIEQSHFPDSFSWMEHARKRLSFDELFVFQMSMMAQRRDWQAVPGQPIAVQDEWLQQFSDTLPYELTGAQRRVLNDIRADIARNVPMNRLLQGDVGSGKTVVAAITMAIAVANGKQAALMAPTSILAEQHARSIGSLLRQSPLGEQVNIRLLTGNTSEAERQEIYNGLAEGWIQVVIGTHALIQQGVNFHDLGVAIIDEQHRFGVEQRGALRGKGNNPHLLIMTATPIPRTLALTLYADLDLSVIDELPPGRTPVETRVLRPVERERVYSFIKSQIEKGRQAFVVYPLVETSEKLEDVGSAVEEYERLQKHIFYKQRVGLLHGRMSPAEKEEVMSRFAAGQLDVLVSTSVVEVGIDIPNASVILIENAERFGLAQLHQFRGRVGRGEHDSFCLLITGSASENSSQRLQAMEETTDGFKLAQIDWEIRGAGDLLGLQQSGSGRFRQAGLMNPHLVEITQREARTVYAEDPNLTRPEHELLARRVQALLGQHTDVS
ncbi:MAG: ATP-dependent DNA helicase RecG [Chloroflexi bacterium]|nr:ATP-dependent DNA helicase RecG [Chloroflexota bacterium]